MIQIKENKKHCDLIEGESRSKSVKSGVDCVSILDVLNKDETIKQTITRYNTNMRVYLGYMDLVSFLWLHVLYLPNNLICGGHYLGMLELEFKPLLPTNACQDQRITPAMCFSGNTFE